MNPDSIISFSTRPARALLAGLCLWFATPAPAQDGPLLNDVREQNGFILAELAEGAFTPEHLLDFEGKTLTITPDGTGGFDLQAGPLQWDADFGQRVDAGSDGFPSTPVTLGEFAFPFAGTTWNEVFVNAFGTVSFGGGQQAFFIDADLDGGDGSLRTFGNTIIQRGVPVIAPLFHFIYDQSDDIFVRQDADALLVTWSISEIHGDIFAFAAEPRINEFQLRLESDGTIRISYKKLELRDGLVGVFAPPECNSTHLLTSFPDATGDTAAGYIDITNASVEAVDQCSLRFTFTFREDLLDEGNPDLAEVLYRVWIDMEAPFFEGNIFDDAEFDAGVGTDGDLAYGPSNQGVELVSHTGNELVYDLDLSRLEGNTEVAVFFDAADFANEEFNTTESATIMPPAAPERRFDLGDDGGFTGLPSAFFEPFHFAVIPEEWDLLCEVLAVTGDRFDFIAFYTDFRFDDGFDFAGAPSSGPIEGDVTGIGESGEPNQCGTDGELEVFQLYVSAKTPVATRKGVINGYPYDNFEPQMALLGHELGHRWLVGVEYVTVDGQTVSLARANGHWNTEVDTPSPGAVTESGFDNSPMNGNYWRDNGDGTFTRLGSDFIFPPKAFSYVDLYLMGLMPPEQVPDFFVIDNLEFVDDDAEGNPVFSGQRIDVSVDDIIDEVGVRQPPAGTETEFDLGLIGIVKPGQLPSSELITRLNGIGQAFESYWHVATDERSRVHTDTDDIILHHGFE